MGTGTPLHKVGNACVTGPNKPLQPVISGVIHRGMQGNAMRAASLCYHSARYR